MDGWRSGKIWRRSAQDDSRKSSLVRHALSLTNDCQLCGNAIFFHPSFLNIQRANAHGGAKGFPPFGRDK
jgi:hypothetical protein